VAACQHHVHISKLKNCASSLVVVVGITGEVVSSLVTPFTTGVETVAGVVDRTAAAAFKVSMLIPKSDPDGAVTLAGVDAAGGVRNASKSRRPLSLGVVLAALLDANRAAAAVNALMSMAPLPEESGEACGPGRAAGVGGAEGVEAGAGATAGAGAAVPMLKSKRPLRESLEPAAGVAFSTKVVDAGMGGGVLKSNKLCSLSTAARTFFADWGPSSLPVCWSSSSKSFSGSSFLTAAFIFFISSMNTGLNRSCKRGMF